MELSRSILLSFAIGFAGLQCSHAATYYVAPWGNNQNNGTSPQTPWQGLFFAGYKLQAGDTLFLRGGIYSNQIFTIPAGVGTPSSPVRVVAYPGEAPILTGSTNYGVVAGIYSSAVIDGLHFENLSNVTDAVDIWGSYVSIQNCTFKNVPFQFIRLMSPDHVTIQNNYFDGNGQLLNTGLGDAIVVGSATHVLVQNNYGTRSGHYFLDIMALPNGGPSSGVVVRDNTVESYWGGGLGNGNAQNLVYEDNRLTHVGEGVAYIKASFEITGMSAIVRHNIVTQNAGWYADNALDILAEDNNGTQDALHNRVYNNVFYKNGYEPIVESQRWERNLADNKVSNNIMYYNDTNGPTFYTSGALNYIFVETYHAYPQCPTGSPYCSDYIWTQFPNNNYFQNNVILHADLNGDHPGAAQMAYVPNTTQAGWTIPGFSDSLAQAQSSFAPFFSGNIEQNPQFVNPDAGDFRLAAWSPAIAAGTHLAHTTAAGTGTTLVPVDDPYSFTDGYGITRGDVVLIGSNPAATITAVDQADSTLTVSTPLNFVAGDPVDLMDHNGAAPDIGALPYSASAPALSGVSSAVNNATQATISWISDTPSTSQVQYGPTTSRGQTSALDETLVTSHNVTLSGLWPHTKYHYAVVGIDAAGGRTVSADGVFTTFSVPGPAISNVAISNVTSTSVTISWVTDIPATAQVFYSGTDRQYIWNPGYVNYSSVADSSGALAHSTTLSGLLPNTLYHFSVQSTDGNGETAHSDDATFITANVPISGPMISGIQIQASAGPVGWFAGAPGQSFAPSGMNCCGYSYAQATFSWATSTPTTNNKVLLIPTVGGGYLSAAELDSGTAYAVQGNPAPTTSPSLTVYQLAPNTTYVYIIQSTDANGNTSTSPNYEFTTPSTDSASGAANASALIANATLGNPVQRISVGADGTSWALDSFGDIFQYNAQAQTWTQIPGSLAQIAVGSSNAVWGINSSGQIYRWDANANGWDWIAGSLSQIAVGADGDTWGLNAQSLIYHFNTATQSWAEIPGSLQQISVGFDGAVWGINFENQVYRFNPGTGTFGEVSGVLTEVSVGADGDVWGLNGENIYHFNRVKQGWDRIAGDLKQLAAGAGTSVWGLDADGQLYLYSASGNGWTSVSSPPLTQISAAPNGGVWGIDGSSNTYQFVAPAQAAQAFVQVPGALANIATGLDGSMWGINAAGQIYTYNPLTGGWTSIPGELAQIAVGGGANVWGINSSQQVYRYNPNEQAWDWIPGSLKQIAVGANGDTWGVNAGNEIYRFDTGGGRWIWTPGSLAQISVGADGAAWGIDGNGEVHRFDFKTGNWPAIQGRFSQVAAGSKSNVWALDSQGRACRLNAQTGTFDSVPGVVLEQIAVAFDGSVWGRDQSNQIFEYNSQNASWSVVPGSLAALSVASDAVVWGINASGSIFVYR
jgi:virginiamycin B lyase